MRTLASAFLAVATAAACAAGPESVWLEQSHDFGAFHEDLGTVECALHFVNVGDEPLSILDVRANCGCTKPRYDKALVFPGDTAVITVGYNPIGRPGYFEKKVVVTTNAVNSPRTSLAIKGTVIATSETLAGRYPIGEGRGLRLMTSSLVYGDVYKPSCSSKYIEGYNATDDTIHPRVLDLPRYMTAMVQPPAVPPGQNFVVSTTFDAGACPLRDVVSTRIAIAAGADTLSLTTTAIVKDDYSRLSPEELERAPRVSLTPESVDLRRLGCGDAPLKAVVTVANNGKTPLKIYRLYTPDAALTPVLKGKDSIKPGKKARIEISIDPQVLCGRDMLDARVMLITNDPHTPRRVIRVTAEIKP